MEYGGEQELYDADPFLIPPNNLKEGAILIDSRDTDQKLLKNFEAFEQIFSLNS